MNVKLEKLSGCKLKLNFKLDSKNFDDNWITGSYSLFYYMQNFFFNKARMNMGLSASINGTGFNIVKKLSFFPSSGIDNVIFKGLLHRCGPIRHVTLLLPLV